MFLNSIYLPRLSKLFRNATLERKEMYENPDDKNVMKNLKDKKNGSFKIHPRMKTMFLKLQESGVKIHAYIGAKLTMTYSHECISNILNAAGVKSN